MSWWGWAARIGGAVAAPFTGGLSALAGNAIGSLDHGGSNADDKPKGNPEDPYTKALGASAATAGAQGKEFGDMSATALTPVLNYFKSLTGSNPAALLDATRMQRGRVIDQYDTARRTAENFGPRGGGLTSALAGSQFSEASDLTDITSQAKTAAAGQLATLGPALANLGLSAQALQTQDLDSIINAVLAREGVNTQKRGQNLALAGDIGKAAGSLLGVWLGRDQSNS